MSTEEFTVWAGAGSHIYTDLEGDRESLAEAIRQSEGNCSSKGPLFH